MRKHNLSIVRGDTTEFSFKIVKNRPTVISGIFFSCAKNYNGDYLFQKTFENGIDEEESFVNYTVNVEYGGGVLTEHDPIENDSWFIYTVTISSDDTKSAEIGDYFYDLKVKTNNNCFTILYGTLSIVQEITLNN